VPVSTLDPAALARLKPAELADLALSSDQEARRLRRAGRPEEAATADRESEALATMFRRK